MQSPHFVVLCAIEFACAACTSSSPLVPAKDGAVDERADSSAAPDTANVYIVPPNDVPPLNMGCGAPSAVNCPSAEVRYYFDPDRGECVETLGCEATGNTFANSADCEAACIRFLHCFCDASKVCNQEGWCGTCPSPGLLTERKDAATVLDCFHPHLACQVNTTDGVLWDCVCSAQDSSAASWRCSPYMGP